MKLQDDVVSVLNESVRGKSVDAIEEEGGLLIAVSDVEAILKSSGRQWLNTLVRDRQHQPTAVVLEAGATIHPAQHLAQVLKIMLKFPRASHHTLLPTWNTSLSAGLGYT